MTRAMAYVGFPYSNHTIEWIGILQNIIHA